VGGGVTAFHVVPGDAFGRIGGGERQGDGQAEGQQGALHRGESLCFKRVGPGDRGRGEVRSCAESTASRPGRWEALCKPSGKRRLNSEPGSTGSFAARSGAEGA